MYFVRPETWVAFLCWSSLGIIVYFLYSRNHSNLNDLELENSLRGHDAILNASEDNTEQD
jgi:hypothetical protein